MTPIPHQISFVVLFVKDLDASRKFYEKTLHFPVKQTDEGYVEFETGGVPLALLSAAAAGDLVGGSIEGSANTTRFSLSLGEVPDVDKVFADLKRAGVKFRKPPTTQPWGQRTAHFTDPDGNLWEVYTWVKKE